MDKNIIDFFSNYLGCPVDPQDISMLMSILRYVYDVKITGEETVNVSIIKNNYKIAGFSITCSTF